MYIVAGKVPGIIVDRIRNSNNIVYFTINGKYGPLFVFEISDNYSMIEFIALITLLGFPNFQSLTYMRSMLNDEFEGLKDLDVSYEFSYWNWHPDDI